MDEQHHYQSRAGETASAPHLSYIRLSRRVAELAVLCLAAFLTFYNLRLYPSPWFDEGIHLLAARTLAFEGQYTFGPAIGPTVLLPVAGAMRIFGPHLLPARLVMTGYMLLSLAAFYALARRLGNWKTATAATLIYLLAPGIELIWYGRQVLGEVPATFFTLIGSVAWLRALDRERRNSRTVDLLVAGFLLGLAILSKNQYLLVLPAWAVVWVLDRLYYQRAGHADFLVPVLSALATAGLWFAAQWLLFPNGQELAKLNVSVWSSKPGQGIFAFSLPIMKQAVKFLFGQDALYGGVVAAWLYAAARSLRRAKEGMAWALIAASMGIWLAWFAVLSAGYPRYAFTPLVLAAICLAHLMYDITDGYRLPVAQLLAQRNGRTDGAQLAKAVLMVFFLAIAARAVNARLQAVTGGGNPYAQQMADYVALRVPGDVAIETYEPEVCFLSGHACHFPPSAVYRESISFGLYGGPPPYLSYPLPEPGPRYLLIGEFGRRYAFYDPQAVEKRYDLEVSMGEYNLYRLKEGSGGDRAG